MRQILTITLTNKLTTSYTCFTRTPCVMPGHAKLTLIRPEVMGGGWEGDCACTDLGRLLLVQ